ncbi:MAG: universal stress protein [Halobacteriales archaeon]
MAPAHVLVPLDGSPLARAAFAHTLETYDCQVTVLNVVTSLDADMSEGGLLEPGDDRLAGARERAQGLIQQASDAAAGRNRTIETAVASGDPAETIVDYVDDHAVDHVVMGGHGGEGGELTRRLLGTVATTVVSEAPVTVTVVR